MKLPTIIRQHFNELADLCERFGVEKLYAFGSVLTDRFDKKTSDLDLMVFMLPMPPIERGENLMALWNALEKLFTRKVDLLTGPAHQKPIPSEKRRKHQTIDL